MPDYAIDYESNIDLHLNQIKNVVVDMVSTDPTGTPGQIIYNTTEHVLKYFDQGAWVVLAQGGNLGNYQLTSQKNQSNGYAGLDANAKILIAQIPTGIAPNTVPIIKGTITDGTVLQYSQASGGFIAKSLSGVYNYKDSVTFANLPKSGQVNGDVYNVTDAFQLDSQQYPAGTNVAWNGTAWDALGGSVNLTGYQTISNMKQDLSSPNADTYPSTNAVSTALAGKQDTISLDPNGIVVTDDDGAMTVSEITLTELGYLDGVGSNIQTQLDGKQTKIGNSSAISTVLTQNLTSNMILVSDTNGKVSASAVSSTLLANLTGLTGPIQTQIDNINTSLGNKADAVTQTGGTYAKVTVNAQGVVTSGQEKIAVADISDLSTTLGNYIPTSQKGVADGVATLGSNNKVPLAQLNTGVGNDTIPVLTGTASTGQVVTYNGTNLTFATPVKRDPVHTITGNGSATSFEVEHTLGVPPLAYTIVSRQTHKVIQTEVLYGDGDTDTTGATLITVNFNTPPADNVSYDVYLVG